MKTFRTAGVRGGRGGRTESPILPPSRPPAPYQNSNAPKGWPAVFLLAVLIGMTTAGCGFYSFSGATIPEGYQTIAIVPVENATTATVSNLDGELTTLLNERFVERTRLQLATNPNNADVVLSGRITGYSDASATVGGGDNLATRNEVSVRAEVQYRESASDSLLIDETYTRSETYDLAGGPAEGDRAAALAALENIADAVYSDATSDW